jgi:hypothetical protein
MFATPSPPLFDEIIMYHIMNIEIVNSMVCWRNHATRSPHAPHRGFTGWPINSYMPYSSFFPCSFFIIMLYMIAQACMIYQWISCFRDHYLAWRIVVTFGEHWFHWKSRASKKSMPNPCLLIGHGLKNDGGILLVPSKMSRQVVK